MNENILSEEFADSIFPTTIFIAVLAVFGLTGNLCVLYVFKYKYPSCNFRYFVLCLAIIDLSSCLFVIPCEIYTQRIWFTFPKAASWFCKLRVSLLATTVFTHSCVLLLISIDRFRKACCPFGWQIQSKTALLMCIVTCVVSSFVCVPVILFFGVQHTNITIAEETFSVSQCLKDDNYKNTFWPTYAASAYYASNVTFIGTTMILYGVILKKTSLNRILIQKYHNIEFLSYSSSRMNIDVIKPEETTEINHSCGEAHRQTANLEDSDYSNREETQAETTLQDNKRKSQDTYRRQNSQEIWRRRKAQKQRQNRIKRKSMIMFTVTLIFNITTFIYICILTLVYLIKEDFLVTISKENAGIIFFFWRLYFIKHVINPVVYGLLDTRFKQAIKNSFNKTMKRMKGKV